MQPQNLTTLIDSIAPINNAVRQENNAIKKVELVWELGSHLDKYLRNNKLTLDELLYSIYDPHATIKRSNITRSLGGYSYRVFHYFKKQVDIKQVLHNLQSYNVFIEALPLLINTKYAPYVKSEDILTLINSLQPTHRIVNRLNLIKQSIIPTRKLRISPKLLYTNEKQLLDLIIDYVGEIYRTRDSISELNNIKYGLNDTKYREQLTSVLMALASDTFKNKITSYIELNINDNIRRLYRIALSNNENRARFRKWVLSSNKLLWLAEAIHALGNDNDFRYFKRKLEK